MLMPIDLLDKNVFKERLYNILPGSTVNMESHFREWSKNKKDIFDLFQGNLKLEFPIDSIPAASEVRKLLEEFMLKHMSADHCLLVRMFLKTLSMKEIATNTLTTDSIFFQTVFKAGMRISRILLKLTTKSGRHSVETAYSMFIQSLKVKGTLVISIDPIDYLTMSESSSGWRSCHSLDGEFRAGTVAYMLDRCTAIAYVTGSNKESKTWRQVVLFNLVDRFAIQSKQYPHINIANSASLSVVLKTLLQVQSPNIEFSINELSACDLQDFVEDEELRGDRLWYNDITQGSGWKGVLVCPDPGTSNLSSFSPALVGSEAFCLCGCGMELMQSDRLFCYDSCEDEEEEEDEEDEDYAPTLVGF